MENTIGGLVAILFIIFIYLIPTFIAMGRRNNAGAIALNVLLGWTVLGWIAAFIWAVSLKGKEKPQNY